MHTHTHLLIYVAIFVYVVQIKGPLQLLPHRPSQQDGQSRDKVLTERETSHRENDTVKRWDKDKEEILKEERMGLGRRK